MTGNDLAVMRRRAGLSQSALAKRVGVSRQTISYWENKPVLDGRATTLATITRAFDQTDRQYMLNSRPGLGFVHLRLSGPITLAHLRVFHAAKVLRSAAHAQMRRQDCGALTRGGTACKLKSEPGRARCRLHGGLSTGPRTVEGKARIAEAQRRRWAKHRQESEKPDKT